MDQPSHARSYTDIHRRKNSSFDSAVIREQRIVRRCRIPVDTISLAVTTAYVNGTSPSGQQYGASSNNVRDGLTKNRALEKQRQSQEPVSTLC